MADKPDKLFSVRTVVVLLIALLVGGGVGALTYFSESHNAYKAVLAGGAAFAGALVALNAIVE